MDETNTQAVVETSAAPTAELQFVDGKLKQVFVVTYSDGSSVPELRDVPTVTTEAPAATSEKK